MSYGTPQPGDDAQMRAWRRPYAEDTERSVSLRLRLALALAHRLRAKVTARGRLGYNFCLGEDWARLETTMGSGWVARHAEYRCPRPTARGDL